MSEALIEFCKLAAVSVGILFVVGTVAIILLVGIEIATSKDFDEDLWEED